MLAKIVDRVFVYDDTVIAIALHGDFGIVLDSAMMAPFEIVEGLKRETKMGISNEDSAYAQYGSDGGCTLAGCKFFVWIPKNNVYHSVIYTLLTIYVDVETAVSTPYKDNWFYT